jgi:hypothetical protein
MYLLDDFVGRDVPDLAYHAALLHDLPDRASDELTHRNATSALDKYFQTLDKDDRCYMLALLADMSTIEDYAQQYRESFTHSDGNLVGLLQADTHKEREVSSRYWLIDAKMAPPETMLKALEEVNLESVLIKSAELLDNLITPPKKEVAVLQDIFEAESFYAPLLEILGYDGFAMALRNQSAILRLQKSNNQEYIDVASEIVAGVVSPNDVTERVTRLMNQLGHEFAMSAVVRKGSGSHDITIGELINEFHSHEQSTMMRGVWRVKSVGSLALKMYEGRSDVPADIVGLTVIAEDLDSVSEYFGQLVTRLPKTEGVKLVPSPSRTEAVHIKGGGNFIEKVQSKLPENTPVDVIGSSDHSGFQVAKVTLVYDGLPIEIQVMTEADRLNSRTGIASHAAYKTKLVDFDHTVLKSIKARREALREATINPASLERAKLLAALCIDTSA